MSNLISLSLVLALAPTLTLSAQGPRPVGVEFAGTGGLNAWFTADDQEVSRFGIDYHIAGIPFWEAGAAATVAGTRLAGASVVGTLDRQRGEYQITAGNTPSERSVKGLRAFIDLRYLADSGERMGRLLAGLRLDFRRTDFHGPATANEQTSLLDATGALNFLNAGEVFAYDARFDDWHLALFGAGRSDGMMVRFGAYSSTIKKPHAVEEQAPGAGAIVETTMSGLGLFGSLSSPSLQILGRTGVVDFSPQSGANIPGLFAGTSGYAFLGNLTWEPRIGIDPGRRVSLVPRFGFQFRADLLAPEDLETQEPELSMDINAEIGLGFVWSFGSN